MFVPIKVTTDYSLMKSLIKIPDLILFLEKNKINICGICDENLFGVMEFYDSCLEYNITPLIGLEVKIDTNTFYIYARGYQGYLTLLKLHTKKEEKILSIYDLETNAKDINIILPYQEIEMFKEFSKIFPNLYVGYTTEYEKNNALIVTKNVLFCPDFKMFLKQDSFYLNMLLAIDTNNSYAVIEKKDYEKNALEYYEEKIELEEVMEEFIRTSKVTIPKDKRYIPKYLEDQDSFSYLKALAYKGLKKRLNGKILKNYEERLEYELSVIEKMGFADYFLIVYDYVFYAKKNSILVGAGRGSAVGSLVSYCLGITDVDPLEYHLLFERFLNPERITMPDIDIDFEESKRDAVVSYVKDRYGKKNVANIMTFGTLKSKLVLRSVGKCLEIHPAILDSFVNHIDAKLDLKENLQNKDIQYLINTQESLKKLVQISLKLEGLKKHISTHAAGVVISSVPIDDVIPIHYNGSELLTGVTMNYLEELGLLKMDFLALRNLTIIANILKLIKENSNVLVNLNKIELNDPKVLEIFTKADTVGVFQFESEGMKNFLRKLKPTSFLDIVSAIALYRPGPMDNIDSFIRRKEGKEKITYLHPDLEPILKETYGIIVYQEQIMQILVKIGGFTFAEADTIRRAMSKKKREVIVSGEEMFLNQAEKRGYVKKIAKEIYDLILKFANYGFNKSHSVSYALIGYQMAYLKCYYPVYYLANLLNMNVDSSGKTKEYIALAKRRGITILPPMINESGFEYKILGNSLLMPFTVIKNLGMESVKNILEEREKGAFIDYLDFVSRTYGKSVNKKTIESLILAGALDSFNENHNTLRENLDVALNYAMLRGDLDSSLVMKPALVKRPELTNEEKRKEEYESFGFYISNHPASKYIDESIMKLENIEHFHNKYVKVVGLLEYKKEVLTKNNTKMAFLTVSDETATGNFVVFASEMKELSECKIGDVLLIYGRVARRYMEYQINVNKIEKIKEGV